MLLYISPIQSICVRLAVPRITCTLFIDSYFCAITRKEEELKDAMEIE